MKLTNTVLLLMPLIGKLLKQEVYKGLVLGPLLFNTHTHTLTHIYIKIMD
jgi:hypothetical protein